MSVEDELSRVVPVLEAIRGKITVPISIDTRRAEVAKAASELGASIVNDTSALSDDPELASVIASEQLKVILMHRRGIPQTMQDNPIYDQVVAEIREFLAERIEYSVSVGIPRENIIADPGLGFGKRVVDNYEIGRRLDEFHSLAVPLLIGASRKSFTGVFDESSPDNRLPASLAFVGQARAVGVEWVRVHDVAETFTFLSAMAAIEDPVLIEGGSS